MTKALRTLRAVCRAAAVDSSALSPRSRITTTRAFPSKRTYATQNTLAQSSRPQSQLWTTSRVLLLAGFVSSITYIVGVKDTAKNADQLVPRPAKEPVYATKKEFEKVSHKLILTIIPRSLTVSVRFKKGHSRAPRNIR